MCKLHTEDDEASLAAMDYLILQEKKIHTSALFNLLFVGVKRVLKEQILILYHLICFYVVLNIPNI